MTIQLSNPEDHNSDGVPEEIRWAATILFKRGDVRELRGFNGRQVVSGYFDDHKTFIEAAATLDDQGYNVYVTLNPVNPALLARANNKVVHRPTATTADHNIVRRRWLLIDIDSVRPSGVSATRQEKQAAFERAKEVKRYLREQGWPVPVIADSGNGFHFLYSVDLPNDQESRELVKSVLEALAAQFNDDEVKIDTGVHNAARIVRLYGTMNRKGGHTSERPHRRSKISKVPKEA